MSDSPVAGKPARAARWRTCWMSSECRSSASTSTRPERRSALARSTPGRRLMASSTPRVHRGQTMPVTRNATFLIPPAGGPGTDGVVAGAGLAAGAGLVAEPGLAVPGLLAELGFVEPCLAVSRLAVVPGLVVDVVPAAKGGAAGH